MLCALILYMSGRTYNLMSIPNDRFLRYFHGRFIYSQSFCQKSAERKTPKKYFSYLIFDYWPGIRTQAFASNKPTHYILDHGDFLTTIDALKDTIRKAIGEIQLHTIDNVLKNWTDGVGNCMASRGSHLNEIIFHY